MVFLKHLKDNIYLLSIPFIWVSLYCILDVYSLWSYWGVQKMEIIFPDLHVLLSAIDAHYQGINVFKENPLCYFKIPHVYSNAWFLFHYLGFSDQYRLFIGITTLIIFSIAVAWLTKKKLFLFVLFLCSPAVLLAIERCNNDVILFLMLLLTAKLAFSKSNKLPIFAHLTLFFCTALKYYPVAFSIIFLLRNDDLKIKLRNLTIHIVFFFAWIFYSWENLQIQKHIIPDPGYAWSFGISPMFTLFTHLTGSKVISFVFLTSLSLIVIYSAFIFFKKIDFFFSDNKLDSCFARLLFVGGTMVLVFCYLVRTSFDHRMIYFAFCFPFFTALLSKRSYNMSKHYWIPMLLFLLITISAWFECLREWITIGLRYFSHESILPHVLFVVRTIEISINHFSFTTLFSMSLVIIYKNLHPTFIRYLTCLKES